MLTDVIPISFRVAVLVLIKSYGYEPFHEGKIPLWIDNAHVWLYPLLLNYIKRYITIFNPVHSAVSSNELSDIHTTQTQASEVRWGARVSSLWVVTSMFS